jgi:hypothetical protein
MTDNLPDRKKYTCLLSSLSADGQTIIHLQKVRKNGRMLAQSNTLVITQEEASSSDVRSALKYLGGTQVIHFREDTTIKRLDAWIEEAGYSRLDNKFFDAQPLVQALCRVPGLPKNPELDDIAHFYGLPGDVRDAARSCVTSRIALLLQVWNRTIRPALTYAQDLNEHIVDAPRDILDVDLSLHGLPLPAPLIPEMSPPKSGWRRTPWAKAEADECALRFVEGADLEKLSTILRRSPRAIAARLTLDGILTAT